MTDPTPLGFTVNVASAPLEPLPAPDPSSILAGAPTFAMAVLDESADGTVVRGIWEMTPGTATDTEEDELFVVVSGRATVEIEGGRTLELSPGTMGVLRRGARTTWTVHETLRKVWQTTEG